MWMEVAAPSKPLYQKTARCVGIDPMRRAVLILLLSWACASSGTSPRISVDLSELRAQNQPVRVVGEHFYRVAVRNNSNEAITIESIHLDLVGTGDFELTDATQSVEATLEPNQTENFEMYVSISRSRPSPDRIDSLRVTLSGHTSSGGFVDSGVYPVSGRQP
jgi:hypothetical protein